MYPIKKKIEKPHSQADTQYILYINKYDTVCRYLATGDSMASIMYSFRIGESTVSGLIKECCLALWEVLKDKVIKLAYTMELLR